MKAEKKALETSSKNKSRLPLAGPGGDRPPTEQVSHEYIVTCQTSHRKPAVTSTCVLFPPQSNFSSFADARLVSGSGCVSHLR